MPKVVPEYKEVAKSKIVEAAREVFEKKGYHDSTMDDIVEKSVSAKVLSTRTLRARKTC